MRKTLWIAALVGSAGIACAQPVPGRRAAPPPAPKPAAAPKPLPPAAPHHEVSAQPPASGEHLASWLDHHSALTPQQQQQELQKEPGFKNLPPQTQQRFKDRLTQLDQMPPEQRNRIIQRTEAMEKLTPEQRGQVRNVMGDLTALPADRRRMVAKTFRSMRDMPVAQRQAYLNSPEVHAQFSDQERNTLSSLVGIEPYLPPVARNEP